MCSPAAEVGGQTQTERVNLRQEVLEELEVQILLGNTYHLCKIFQP
jgi:queuine/archaeosine tRNA-ribosyltransferase